MGRIVDGPWVGSMPKRDGSWGYLTNVDLVSRGGLVYSR